MRKDSLKEIFADFHQQNLDFVIDREVTIPLNIPKVISLIGPRRSGKTTVCFQLIRTLRQQVPADRITYLNFEDDRLYPLSLEDMDMIMRAYYELFPANKEETVYFFFDEVQEVPNWEKFVRRIVDTENCRLFITGSSANLLSRELATALRGRTLPYEILPLSFSEFLTFTGVEANIQTTKGKVLVIHALEKYINQGAFPELIFLPEEVHRRTVSEYIDLMLYRDLTERFGVRNPALLKYLLKYTLGHAGKFQSINKVFQDLKSQGYTLSKNTVYEYLSYLEEAFAIFRVTLWSTSLRKQTVNPDKIYALDPAFKYVMSNQRDRGHILENMVYLHLRRLGHLPHYWMSKQEVDFFVPEKLLINVSYDLSDPQTKRREISGLQSAMKETGLAKSYLITREEEGEVDLEGTSVQILPAYRFFLMSEI